MQLAKRCAGQLTNLLLGKTTVPNSTISAKELLLPTGTLGTQQVRGVKDKHVLKLRCPSCYFKKQDERWWVLCDRYPRHKQRERIDNKKEKWIVTHVTRGGRPFQKKPEAYICNTAPPGPFDYTLKIWKDKDLFPKLKKVDYYC